jgi:hypothetical protein
MNKVFLFLLTIAASQSGAQLMAGAFPDTQDQIAILVLTQAPGDSINTTGDRNLPLGIYHVANSNVYISDVQGDEDIILPGMLFGTLGVAVASGEIAGDSKSQIQDLEKAITLDIPKITEQKMEEALSAGAGGKRFTLGASSGDSSLQIFPYMVFSFAGKEKARLWVILKATFIDYNFNKVEWECRYIAGLGKPRSFKGPDGWASLNPVALEAETLQDTQAVIGVMLKDLTGNLRNEKAPRKEINGYWVFYKDPHKSTAQVLSSDDQEDIVMPLGDDKYFAGANILPKDFAVQDKP